ncbi:hypothetical protein J4208_05355 [Candidatus Woesearchaeota archaeon]|nr:hypothetical protein [Candidatus Woesearchaeota archaeon]
MKKKNIKVMITLVISGLLLFLLGLILGRSITGAFTGNILQNYEALFSTIIIAGIALAILLFFLYINRGNIVQLGKSLISTLAILSGLYALFKYVHDIELISVLLTLSFGVWAIIWTINAYSVLSKGSTIRQYTGSFLACLIFVMLYSLWDFSITIFKLSEVLVYVKYIIIIFVYTTFVFTAYRIYKIGKEFGFAEESSRIKKILTFQKKKSN